MFQDRRSLIKRTLLFLVLSFTAFYFYKLATDEQVQLSLFQDSRLSREMISKTISAKILNNEYPTEAVFGQATPSDPHLYKINYTLQPDLQSHAQELLERYRPDYAAIVMMDAKTGEILAMSSFEKKKDYGSNLALKATYPAASIFKVITAATAIDRSGLNPDHRIAFNGGNYTLFKKNVLSDKVNRWTRFITMKDAFARSINTAFGRLSMESIEPHDLSEYANRFLFNQEIPSDFHVQRSVASVPTEKGFELTEVASGYNRFNTLSPVHGALIASTIVNGGKMPDPHLVKTIMNAQNESIYSRANLTDFDIAKQIITPESAEKVKQMMEQTVLSGTSRKTFRQFVRDRKFKEVEMGGKTGHFSGTDPKGRTDWFVGYASDGTDKIAIATITVNVEKWTVKSSALGEMMFRKYFKTKLDDRDAALSAAAEEAPQIKKTVKAKKRRS